MKKTSLLILSLLLPMLVFSSVAVAQTGDTSSPETTDATQATETDTKLQQRLERRKEDLMLKLQTAEQTRLKGRCRAAQALLKGVSSRLDSVSANHTKSFDKVSVSLDALVPKLKAAGLDTSVLEQQISEYKGKVESYKTDLTTYQQAVADMTAMDCVSDPEAFKATLETARTLRQKLVTSAAETRGYVNDTIKPTLVDLRSQLPQTETN